MFGRRPNRPEQTAAVVQDHFKRYRTMFEQEKDNAAFVPLPGDKAAKRDKFVRQRIKQSAEDPISLSAWTTYQGMLELQGLDAKQDDVFRKDFYAWLCGKGKEVDHRLTPWGREPHALQLPDVRLLLADFVKALTEVETYLLKLIYMTPQTLGEYAIYYKYCLHPEQWRLHEDPWIFLEFPEITRGAEWVDVGDSKRQTARLDPAVPGDRTQNQWRDPSAGIEPPSVTNNPSTDFLTAKKMFVKSARLQHQIDKAAAERIAQHLREEQEIKEEALDSSVEDPEEPNIITFSSSEESSESSSSDSSDFQRELADLQAAAL